MAFETETARGRKASILEFFLTIFFAIVGLVYLTTAAYTRDMLWFWPLFNAQPSSALIRCYGKEIYLDGSSQELKTIAEIVNKQISGKKRWDELNLTDQTYETYRTSPNVMILELYYATPQRIHSPSPFFSGFTELLIPLDGQYADTSIFFSLVDGKPSGSSFHVESFSALTEYLSQSGLCTKK
ncbi:MAG TPA: hypothetical protein VNK49_06830 [Anaerolineales bacterium]|nr:hypothetical protein [Anaerolineales bacterium]